MNERLKVLILNGSPHANGAVALAISEMTGAFAGEGVDCKVVQVGGKAVRGCTACGYCHKNGKCVFDDGVNEIAEKLKTADGLVLASPVYYASANGTLVALLDRLFYSIPYDLSMKVGASIVCARRSGCTSSFDELNKYFAISGMPIVTSQYWNNIHGNNAAEAAQDLEGRQTMRTLARNMSFLMKSIALGRERFGLPEAEPCAKTNFIR